MNIFYKVYVLNMNLPQIVGVLNVTPDSFSGDGVLGSEQNIIAKCKEIIDSGVSVIDVGAESRRPPNKQKNIPGATLISAEEEWNRLSEVMEDVINLAHENKVRVSVDTRHPQTAKRCIALGVDIVNDAGGCADLEMIKVLSESDVEIILMHNLGILGDHTCNVLPDDVDVISVITEWGKEKISTLNSHGISTDRIVFDVGIGYGKTSEQSWEILRNIGIIKNNFPENKIYVGHSRKSLYNLLNVSEPQDRDLETVITSYFLMEKKVDYLRVHNVQWHQRAFNFIKMMSKK